LHSVLALQLCRKEEKEVGRGMCANLLVTAWVPAHKGSEIAKVFAKNPTIKGVKRLGKCPYSSPTEHGMRIIDIFEVEDAKVPEAIREIVKWEQQYAVAVPEFTYSLEPLLTPDEAFMALGMQPPK
jgi:hypothetical protein